MTENNDRREACQIEFKNIKEDVRDLKDEVKAIREQTGAIIEMGQGIRHLGDQVKETVDIIKNHDERLDNLERAPGQNAEKRLKKIEWLLISLLIGAIFAFLWSSIGL